MRSRWIWRGSALALVLAMAVALATVRPLQAAAQSFLDLFHAKRLQPITLDPAAFGSLPKPAGPDAFGRFEVSGGRVQAAGSPEEAQSLLGGAPVYRLTAAGWAESGGWQVIGATQASLTIDRAKLESYLRQAGWSDAQLPQALDGATFTVRIPPAVVSQWLGPDSRRLTLVQGAQPQIDGPPGLDARFLQQLLLQMPGMPADLRQQLQAIGDWRETLPVPVSKGTVSQRASVPGALDALYLADPATGSAGLLWLEPDGSVLRLGGQGVSRETLLAVAASVRAK
ncbi:MAG: hypothetical protein QJR08_09565 [Bacillota bacterium]|nr:hypothetical protein [Bacillota bacterium]